MTVLLGILIIVGSLIAHEWAHAFTARIFGDDTAARRGRLSWNPLAHVDPILTVFLPALTWMTSHGLVVFGGAKPLPVAWHRLKPLRRGGLAVALAGIVANGFLAAVGYAFDWSTFMRVNLVLAGFNLLPLPPLDGWRVVSLLWPKVPAFFAHIGAVLRSLWDLPNHRALIEGVRADFQSVSGSHVHTLQRAVDTLNKTTMVTMDVEQRLDYHERSVLALQHSRARLEKRRADPLHPESFRRPPAPPTADVDETGG